MTDWTRDLAELERETRATRRRLAVAGPPGATVDTLHLLRAAVADDPARWRAVEAAEPDHRLGEGGRVPGTGWTVVACDAVLIAQQYPSLGADTDIHDVAVAGALAFWSTAGAAVDRRSNTAVEQVGGLSTAGAVDAMTRAAAAPGGRVFAARIDLDPADGPPAGVPGNWGSTPNPSAGQVIGRRVEVVHEPPLRGFVVPEPPARTARVENPGFVGSLVLSWRPVPRVLWWARPLLTLAAVALLVLAGSVWWQTVPAVLAVVVVRPTRRYWTAALPVVPLAVLAPSAAALVVVRTFLTYLALRLDGGDLAGGLTRLRARRTAYADEPAGTDLDTAWTALEAQLHEPGDELMGEGSFRLLGAAWAEADAVRGARTVGQVLRGHLTGAWPFGYVYSTGNRFALQALRETVVVRCLRFLTWACAALAGWYLGAGAHHVVLGHDVARWVVAGSAGFLAAGLARPDLRRPRVGGIRPGLPAVVWAIGIIGPLRAVLLSALVLWAGDVVVLAVAWAIGLLGAAVKHRVTRFAAADSFTAPSLPWRARWGHPAAVWHAAELARRSGGYDAARSLWTSLTHDGAPGVARLATAMLAVDDVAVGRWEEASATIEEARAGVEPHTPLGRRLDLLAAEVWLVVGDEHRALDAVRRVSASRPGRLLLRAPRARMVHARALAAAGHSGAAMKVLSGRLPAVAFAGPMLEAETAISGPLGATAPHRAASRLVEVLGIVDMPDLTVLLDDPRQLRELATVTARTRLTLGLQLIRLGRVVPAEESLRIAVRGLVDPQEAVNRATARILLGYVRCRRRSIPDALALIESGLTELEGRRAQLRRSDQRRNLVVSLGVTHTLALDALTDIQAHDGRAAVVAGVHLESLRQDALADLVRAGGVPQADGLADLLDRADALGALPAPTPAEQRDLADLRERVARTLSESYVQAYAPDPVTATEVRARLAGADLLIIRIAAETGAELTGHSVWWPAAGEPEMTRVLVDDTDELALLGLGDPERRRHLLQADQVPGTPAWQVLGRLADALLPPSARAALAGTSDTAPRRLVVVPDGRLSALPWAALRLSDGRVLAQPACLQLSPSVRMLEPRPDDGSDRSDGSRVVLHRADEMDGDAQRLLTTVARLIPAASLDDLRAELTGSGADGVLFAAHGGGVGAGQAVALADGRLLTPQHALSVRWPGWVVFASCFVGSPAILPGTEPAGIAISCLLGGATTFVAGVVPVQRTGADRMCARTVAGLVLGLHPAAALRSAQLAVLRERPRASVHRWAGFMCTSRSVPGSTGPEARQIEETT